MHVVAYMRPRATLDGPAWEMGRLGHLTGFLGYLTGGILPIKISRVGLSAIGFSRRAGQC